MFSSIVFLYNETIMLKRELADTNEALTTATTNFDKQINNLPESVDFNPKINELANVVLENDREIIELIKYTNNKLSKTNRAIIATLRKFSDSFGRIVKHTYDINYNKHTEYITASDYYKDYRAKNYKGSYHDIDITKLDLKENIEGFLEQHK